jgi:hypothetical protein
MKRVTISLTAAAAVAALLALGAGAAAASSHAKAQVVPIVMKDPGCHWFSVQGKLKARFVASGDATFRNLDEAPLVVVGKGFHKRVAVGKTLSIATRGTYRITMVGQHPDDNHLLLVVK